MIGVVLVFPLMPMIISGLWDWRAVWGYAIVSMLGFVLSRILASRCHPDLLVERTRSMELQDAKSWDKTLAPMTAFGSIIPLDGCRFR